MAGILDMTKFTFEGELIDAISEMVFDEVLNAPDLNLLHVIYPDIVTTKEVGFVGEGGLVGVKGQGCDPQPQDWKINTRKVKWTPEEWEVLIHACYTDLVDTAAVYSLKTGTEIGDFTDTDYMNIVVIVLANSLKEFLIRLVWFNDVDADNVANGGLITNGVDVKYFNIIDGLWKQIIIQYTANPAQRITIAENAGATYLAQRLDPTKVRDEYLPNLVYEANMILRAQANGSIFCTQSFYDGYSKSLKGINLESMMVNLIDGRKTLTYDGKPLVAVPVWDKIILAYENNGVKLNNPHRAIYTTKEVLAVGCDDPSSFTDIDVWYNKDERKVKMEGMGKADAKLANPALFTIAI